MAHLKAIFHLENIIDVAVRSGVGTWGTVEKATSLSDCHFAKARLLQIQRNIF